MWVYGPDKQAHGQDIYNDPTDLLKQRSERGYAVAVLPGGRVVVAGTREVHVDELNPFIPRGVALVYEGKGKRIGEWTSPDPAGLHERLTERLDVLNRQRHALDNQGINHRGNRENVPAPGPDVPLAAVPFVHRGEFVGWSVGLAAVAASLPGMPETPAEIRDAHMRGDRWTVARDGLVYVFRCRPGVTSTAA